MKAIIKITKDNDVFILKYHNIYRVYVQDLYIIVECSEQYEVNSETYVRKFNCSTTSYKHAYRNARIVGAYQ